MKIITTSPFYAPLKLCAGLDPHSAAFAKTLAAIPEDEPQIHVPNRQSGGQNHKYDDLQVDDYDLRLFIYAPDMKKGDGQVRFHVYGNGVCVFSAEFETEKPMPAKELEQYSQARTRALFDTYAPGLQAILQTVYDALPAAMIERGTKITQIKNTDICWISRAVIMKRSALKTASAKAFITAWLENTARPDDANAILAGEMAFSMTWLNYLVVEPGPAQKRSLFSALRIAQYFYSSQERLNNQAYLALTDSALEKNVRIVERRLIAARRAMQMLHIMYDMQKSFLNRKKRELLADLMTVWEYDTLKANGDRMVTASDTQITEITNKRLERSSFFTDLILVGLALVTVIEVSMYLTEYSRELMSRPALAYQDDKVSWILSSIAAIDTDRMLIGGTFVILILVSFYVYWKIRR